MIQFPLWEQDTVPILRELGYSQAEIDQMRRDSVV